MVQFGELAKKVIMKTADRKSLVEWIIQSVNEELETRRVADLAVVKRWFGGADISDTGYECCREIRLLDATALTGQEIVVRGWERYEQNCHERRMAEQRRELLIRFPLLPIDD